MTATAVLITPDPDADEARRRGCVGCGRWRCPCWASPQSCTSPRWARDGFLGFVNAGAEASMVGAIADWFAVTALFKHPLGLRSRTPR
jgi:hypothetical protein